MTTSQKEFEPKIEALSLNSIVTTDRCCIRVTDIRPETVTGQLLDDQSNLVIKYGHPVYVGVRKSEILSLSEPKPEPESTTLSTVETNLIPFPSPKNSEPQPATLPQSNNGDSFYLQSYRAWVNKLVARGEYGKIKSYEEWYAIAVEVM
jgi:hypothetical protein